MRESKKEKKEKELPEVLHIQDGWRNNFELSNPSAQAAGTVPARFLLIFCFRVVYLNYPTFVLIVLTSPTEAPWLKSQ